MPAQRPFSLSFGRLFGGLSRGSYTLASGALFPAWASDLETMDSTRLLLGPLAPTLPHRTASDTLPHLASCSCTDSGLRLQLQKLHQPPRPRPAHVGASALTPSLSSLLRTDCSGVCIPLPLPAWGPPDQPLHQPPSPTSHVTPSVPPAAQLPQGSSLASYTVLRTIPCSRLLDQGRQGSPECRMSSTGAGSLLVWAERPWWWWWGALLRAGGTGQGGSTGSLSESDP